MATPRYPRFWLQLTDLFKLAIWLWLSVTLRHRHPLSRSQLPIIFGVADSEYDFTSRRGAPVAESKSLKSLIFQFHTSVQQRQVEIDSPVIKE